MAAALPEVLLIPNVSKDSFFLLVIVGAFEPLTLTLDTDLVRSVSNLVYVTAPTTSHEETVEKGVTALLITTDGQQGWRRATSASGIFSISPQTTSNGASG